MKPDYRGYDTATGTMHRVSRLDFPEHSVGIQTESNMYMSERNSMNNEPTDRVMVMQFTGKHDVNGKRIFVGDRVKLSQVDGSAGEVYFDTVRAQFRVKHTDGTTLTISHDHIIVGNIYEARRSGTNCGERAFVYTQ